jgi:hypothetical protein
VQSAATDAVIVAVPTPTGLSVGAYEGQQTIGEPWELWASQVSAGTSTEDPTETTFSSELE